MTPPRRRHRLRLADPGQWARWNLVAPDGNFWFAEFNANRLGRLSYDGALTEFILPHPNSFPAFITVGRDGALWFTERESTGNRIGRITVNGTINEFPLPGQEFGRAASPRARTGTSGSLSWPATRSAG